MRPALLLLLLLLPPPTVAEGSVAHQRSNLDVGQLLQLDLDPLLMNFIGNVVTKVQRLENELHAVENKTHMMEAENTALRLERVHEKRRVASLERIVFRLSNKTADFEAECKAAVHEFSKIASNRDGLQGDPPQDHHRRVQEDQSAGAAKTVRFFQRRVSAFGHLSGHVDEPNGGHRLLAEEGAECSGEGISRRIDAINVACCDEQGEDCSGGRVSTCNAGCGALIMPLWTACQAQLGPAAQLLENAVALCPPSAAGTGGTTGGDGVSFNSMNANMYMASCPPGLPADDCIPVCEEATNGYLLLLNINGEDTKLTCELHHWLYSWVGGAADGGYIGEDVPAFVSAVLSHAGGVFAVTLITSATTGTTVDLVAGQTAQVGVRSDGPSSTVTWTCTGSGAAFQIGAGATLQINQITVSAASGLAFRLDSGSSLSGSIRLASGPISCDALAADIGSAAFDCTTTGPSAGPIMLTGPIVVSTSGAAFALGSVKYLGAELTEFTDALYTREAGLYTLDVSTDVSTSTVVPVEPSMHVRIDGDAGSPAWVYNGEGAAFTVAAAGFMAIHGITVDAGEFDVAGGGSLSFSGAVLSGDMTVGAGATVLIAGCSGRLATTSVTQGALTIDSGSSLTFSGSVQVENNGRLEITDTTLQLSDTVGREGECALVAGGRSSIDILRATFQSTAQFCVAEVAAGAQLNVEGAQLVHGVVADPFPCDGADMACIGPHTEPVLVPGFAVVGTAGPLVCDAGNCQSDPCAARFGTPCANGGRCDYATGTCACAEGWLGDTCDLPLGDLTCDFPGQLTDAQTLLVWRAGLSVVPDDCPVAQWGGDDVCGWRGVNCGSCETTNSNCRRNWGDVEHGERVTAVYIAQTSGNDFNIGHACGGIVGPLSSCWARLEYLRLLDLHGIPGLSGAVPAELIDGLPHLNALHLQATAVDGPSCHRACESHGNLLFGCYCP